MTTVNATEAHNDIGRLWKEGGSGLVTVLSVGQPVAVVLSPAEFEKLTARRRGVKTGFAMDLFKGKDMNVLLDTSIKDVFEGYL